ncbi:response regulator [Daejeonella lutea]|uniref:Response regulator receiver domain-containing protein n=1 Tax=Daejeonella lutea TaxID=572036 RepID=A0A1T5CY85_9SPHI|nr:response regulator [Daejeonella lutea]SKB64321.1 Response regulator receiver domain-containing protein [Daejeonella lutea]
MKKVFVIDDNPDILDAIRIILEEEKFVVECFDSAEDVFDKIVEGAPDLVILDIVLAGSDGRLLCKDLKTSHQTRHIPIIIISGAHDFVDSFEKHCRPDNFVSKPFQIEDLLTKVRNHVLMI